MKLAIIAARCFVAIGLIGYLLHKIDMRSVIARLSNSDLRLIGLGTMVLALQPLLGALRWTTILACNRSAVPLGRALRWTYIGVFFGQVLPATIGADAMKIWYASRQSLGLKNAITSVTLDRLFMLFAMIVLLSFGGSLLGRYVEGKFVTVGLLPRLSGSGLQGEEA